MEELHKDSYVAVKKATSEELKTLIPDPAEGTMSVNILSWAMNQADSDDAGRRKPRHQSTPIELDSGEEEKMMVQIKEKTKTKAKATRRSSHLQGPRG
ncbi:Chitinase domain-containing protein 1 [Hordeum vulgare]|nr:Chitinase domain-containing protein 1 [Hordeum vulgare]